MLAENKVRISSLASLSLPGTWPKMGWGSTDRRKGPSKFQGFFTRDFIDNMYCRDIGGTNLN